MGDLGESTEFCRQWAQAMLAERSDAIRLKRVIHNYGLQVITRVHCSTFIYRVNHVIGHSGHKYIERAFKSSRN